jgi:hypothetical protein
VKEGSGEASGEERQWGHGGGVALASREERRWGHGGGVALLAAASQALLRGWFRSKLAIL